VFLYIKNTLELSIIDENEFIVGYHCLNKLNKFIRRHKDFNHLKCNNNYI